MARALSQIKDVHVLLQQVAANRRYLRSIKTPQMPNASESPTKLDVLYPLRPPAAPSAESTLAGNPKRVATPTEAVKEDIFEKWNQRPARDIYREWLKSSIIS